MEPLPSRPERDWKGVHTCHAECPCQTGGEPMADFPDMDDVARGMAAAERGSPLGSLHSDRAEIRRLRAALERIASDECMVVRDPDHGVYIDTGMPAKIAKEALSA